MNDLLRDIVRSKGGMSTLGEVQPKWCGAIADGTSHHLSERYSTLAQAQAVYPFATALTQEIDYCACKLASNICFGADGSENGTSAYLNKALHISAGQYYFGNDTWLIRNLNGGLIYGDGNATTALSGESIVLQFDGIWYTTIKDLRLFTNSAGALTVLDIDGNVPGHPYPTRGVQAVTLINLLIAGSGGTYAFTWTRQGNGPGGPGAQGDGGTFINIHLLNADTLYYQWGFNSLNNQFLGGDFQVFTTGAFIDSGTCNFIATSFESTLGFAQVTNSAFGYDIVFGLAGVNEPCLVQGTRSEGYRHIRNDGAQVGVLNGCCVIGAPAGWVHNATYAAGSVVAPTVPTGRIYYTAAGGTAGGTEPTWPTNAWAALAPTSEGGVCGSTVADGTITWQEYIFYSIKNNLGPTQGITSCAGLVVPYAYGTQGVIESTDFNYNNWRNVTPGLPSIPPQDVNVDAASGLVSITMPETALTLRSLGRYEITKTDTTLNPVVLRYGSATGVFGDFNVVTLSSPYEKVRLTEGFTTGGARAFYKEKTTDTWSYYTPTTVSAINGVTFFTINQQDKFLLDTTAGTITVNLAGPNVMGVTVAKPGMTFRIRDPQGTWGTNAVTVNPQGYKINGSTSNLVLSTNYAEVIFTYIDDTIGWQTQFIGGSSTVANLPAVAYVQLGTRSFVTDSNATLAAGIGNIVAGSGANKVPVYSDGTNWRIG